MTGTIDHLRVFNRAITEDEVHTLFTDNSASAAYTLAAHGSTASVTANITATYYDKDAKIVFGDRSFTVNEIGRRLELLDILLREKFPEEYI